MIIEKMKYLTVSILGLPFSENLLQKIPKKLFLQEQSNCKFTASDKRLFQENVKSVYLFFQIDAVNGKIPPYKSSNREYNAIPCLFVTLKERRQYKRIAELIHRSIPEPLFIALAIQDDYDVLTFSVAPKRLSLAEHNARVVEKIYVTDFIEMKAVKEEVKPFLNALNVNSFQTLNCNFFFQGWIKAFLAYQIQKLVGDFILPGDAEIEKTVEAIEKYNCIQSEIGTLRKNFKSATLAEQVKLNIKIKKLESELKNIWE